MQGDGVLVPQALLPDVARQHPTAPVVFEALPAPEPSACNEVAQEDEEARDLQNAEDEHAPFAEHHRIDAAHEVSHLPHSSEANDAQHPHDARGLQHANRGIVSDVVQHDLGPIAAEGDEVIGEPTPQIIPGDADRAQLHGALVGEVADEEGVGDGERPIEALDPSEHPFVGHAQGLERLQGQEDEVDHDHYQASHHPRDAAHRHRVLNHPPRQRLYEHLRCAQRARQVPRATGLACIVLAKPCARPDADAIPAALLLL
mmetsp:Transcript_87796/g.253529  ORF Transcript_87796/g.253529 Transcript_87796/m.253529 type:complete len:259 (-) Transcript_87796:297-1073(-)